MRMRVSIASEFLRTLLQRGRYTFTRDEAEAALGSPRATMKALRRLEVQGWLVSPGQCFYVIQDPLHQVVGLPVEWFLDDWARHLGVQYYVGLLTAAMLHGAAHQKPQQFQVVVDRQLRPVMRGPYHVQFLFKKHITAAAWETRQSPAGYYRVSTPEMTAYDLLRYPKACPTRDMAATILAELGEVIHDDRLTHLLDQGAEIVTLQRLGWMLDAVGWSAKTEKLAGALQSHRHLWQPLRPDLPADGPRDPHWRIIVNETIEVEI